MLSFGALRSNASRLVRPKLAFPRSYYASYGEVTESVTVTDYIGSRAVELARPESGNLLTVPVLEQLKAKLDLYKNIHTIRAIFITSSSVDTFSNGLAIESGMDKTAKRAVIEAANTVAQTVSNLDRSTIGVFHGDVDSRAFAMLATSRFKLGSGSTQLRVNDLLEHRLPLGGGLAYHLAKTGNNGYAVRRSFFDCLKGTKFLMLCCPVYFPLLRSWHDTWH
jgi:hypothetical protein